MAKRHVLFIEDNDMKFSNTKRFLSWQGLTIVRAETYSEACDHLLRRKGEVAFILTDWSFPIGNKEVAATACAGEAVVKMAKDLGIPYAVLSGLDRPHGFEGDWICAAGPGMLGQLKELAARIRAM